VAVTGKVTLKGTVKRLQDLKKEHRAAEKRLEERIKVLEKTTRGKKSDGDDDEDDEDEEEDGDNDDDE